MIDCLNFLSYTKLITKFQSRNIVYLISNFEIYSFVIKIAILVYKAALDKKTIPTVGLVIHKVELVFVEPPPIKFSVTFNNTFII